MTHKKIDLEHYELTPVARKALEIQQKKGIDINTILAKLEVKVREERFESKIMLNINLNSPKLTSIARGSNDMPCVQPEYRFDNINTPSYFMTRLSHGNGAYSLRPLYKE